MCIQTNVNKALTKTLESARASATYPLGMDERYVIFSDQHKGGRTLADDFLPCENTYRKALSYYYQQGYTLVVLGDVEGDALEERLQNLRAGHGGTGRRHG